MVHELTNKKMALTTSQEQELLAMNEAFKAGKAITDLDLATSQDLKHHISRWSKME